MNTETAITLITGSFNATLRSFHAGLANRADETGVEAPALTRPAN